MTIGYIKNPREAISNVLELIRESSNVSGPKINIKKINFVY